MQPRTRSGLWGFCVAVGLSTVMAAQQPAARPMALVGGTLIDGSGGPPMRDSVVLVRGGRIERVGTVETLPVPSGYERISTEGMTVLPGLWDLHVHLIYNGHPNVGVWFKHSADFERVTIPASARQMLMAGVTSVRDMAAPPQAILGVKKRIASGDAAGTHPLRGGTGAGQAGARPDHHHAAVPADCRCGGRARQDAPADRRRRGPRQDVLRRSHVGRRAQRDHQRGPRPGAQDRDARPERCRGAPRAGTRHRRLPAHRHRQSGVRARHHGGAARAHEERAAAVLDADSRRQQPAERGLHRHQARADRTTPRRTSGCRSRSWTRSRPAGATISREPRVPTPRRSSSARSRSCRRPACSWSFGSDEGSAGELPRHATWMDADLWVRVLGMAPMDVLRKHDLGRRARDGRGRRGGYRQRRQAGRHHCRRRRSAASHQRAARPQGRDQGRPPLQVALTRLVPCRRSSCRWLCPCPRR